MKVAMYARYSSDNQRDASIADQLRICREFAARQGWTVVQEFTDVHHGRPQSARMLRRS
jgi:site-specific DNA recombinase